MPGGFEEMGVGVEGHARAGVAEDAADLDDVGADVDDQVAGEGVAQVVEADPPAIGIEPRVDSRSTEHTLGDVVVEKWRAVCRREHVIGTAREAGAAFVLTENGGKLGEKRDLPDGGARLRRDTVRRHAAAAARELMANANDGSRKVDVVPAEREHFGEPHARVRPGEEQRSVAAGAGGEKLGELRRGKDALVGPERVRPLVALEPVERVRVDVTVAEREREDAAERGEDPLDRPGRQTSRLQLAHDRDDIVGRDQRQTASTEPGQQMAVQLRAVEIECTLAPNFTSNLALELS